MLASAAPGDRVRALADALSADGYAASAFAAPLQLPPGPAPAPAPADAAAGTTAMPGEAAAAGRR